ncbi:hypothetical protein [Myxococcus qinghaiensis]|uniref:hypothetical protein n=1 Tax=Myxococcus qinghaiensis TaxID=2906758 RepID=UPI0020A74D71|nr:hypothetical protein [Myxococcus qinghaiensis]MCP3165444.1 hypothetical protein [Myxococcus qinghaiensis]
MNRRLGGFVVLAALFLTPGVVSAKPRAFDFSGGQRSARLRDTPTSQRFSLLKSQGVRGLDTSTSDTVNSDNTTISPVALGLALVVTGGGLIGAAYLCLDGHDNCGYMLLVGPLAGLVVLATFGSSDTQPTCDEWDEDCAVESESTRRPRAAARMPRGLTLPLGLAPTLNVGQDRASFGLGGHF